jgi:hypothetical protein
MTDPEWPIQDVILNNREAGDVVGFGRFQSDLRNLTQHFFAAQARQSIA